MLIDILEEKKHDVLSFYDARDIDDNEYPEVCFIGRSNVGKSSLLNTLIGTNEANVSKTPGKTKAIHLIKVDEKLCVVDMPGFGYAKVGEKNREKMSKLLNTYIQKNDPILHYVPFVFS